MNFAPRSALLLGAVSLCLFALASCSTEPNNADGGGGSGGSGGNSGGSGGSAGNGGSGGNVDAGCERFSFVRNGASCGTTGCSPVQCYCDGGFPKAFTSCATGGCLISMNCAQVCAEDTSLAFSCLGTYTLPNDAGNDAGRDGGVDAGVDGGLPNGTACTAALDCTSHRCVGSGADAKCSSGAAGSGCDAGTDCLSAVCSASQCVDWVPRVAKTYGPSFPIAAGLTTSGHLQLWASTIGPGGVSQSGPFANDGGFSDGLVAAALGPSGTLAWMRHFPGARVIDAKGAVASNGRLAVCGELTTSWDFGKGPLIVGPNAPRFIEVMLEADAGTAWNLAFKLSPDGGAFDQCQSLGFDSTGGLVSTLQSSVGPDFDAGFVWDAGAGAVVIMRHDSSGALTWFRATQPRYGTYVRSTQPTANGCFASGHGTKPFDFGLGLTTTTDQVGYIAEWTPTGTLRRYQTISDGGFRPWDARPDADGGFVVFADFNSPASVGGVSIAPSGPRNESAVARFFPDGGLAWTRQFISKSQVSAHALGLLPNGDVLVAGDYGNGTDFGAGWVTTAPNVTGGFVVRLNAAGALQSLWLQGGTASGSVRFNSLGPTADGGVWVVGDMTGAQVFGGVSRSFFYRETFYAELP